jgi:exodeoxyribonuclease VII small subunit
MTAADKKKFNFAKTYQELQKLVVWFEQEDVDLEEGINKFEEGIKLAKELKEYLNTTENKIKELKKLS